MRKILFTSALFFVAFIANAQVKKTQLNNENLKGKVRSVDVLLYTGEEKDRVIVKGKQRERTYQLYNKNGFLSESLVDNYTDKISYKSIKFYDENNNLIKHEYRIHKTDGGGTDKTEITESKYNDQGIIEEIEYTNGSLQRKTLYTYLDNGLTILIDRYGPKGNLYYTKVEKLNQQKSVVSSNSKSLISQITRSEAYKYDQWENMIEKISSSNEFSNFQSTETYTYNILQQQVSSYLNESLQTTIEYDTIGNPVKVIYNFGGISGTQFDVYVYDKWNNWIKKTTSSPLGVEIRERKIDYF